jgi:hypothetical protein
VGVVVDDVKECQIAIAGLHLLRRRASLGLVVHTPVVQPGNVAGFRSIQIGHSFYDVTANLITRIREILIVNVLKSRKLA